GTSRVGPRDDRQAGPDLKPLLKPPPTSQPLKRLDAPPGSRFAVNWPQAAEPATIWTAGPFCAARRRNATNPSWFVPAIPLPSPSVPSPTPTPKLHPASLNRGP